MKVKENAYYRIPGLVGIFGVEGNSEGQYLEEFLSLFPDDQKPSEEEIGGKLVIPIGFAAILKRNEMDYSRTGCFAENELYACLSEGEYFSNEGKRENVEWVLANLTKKGRGFFDSLNGTYTLGIYDKTSREFILRTDRYSTRLFYYSINRERLVFANDIRFLLRHQSVDREINTDAIYDYINFEFMLCNETMYRSINVFPHGKELVWDGARVKWKRYWDYPDYLPTLPGAKIEDYIEETIIRMRAAVKRRATNKEKRFITLSSGLDSRAIACFLSEISKEPIACLTLGHSDFHQTKWAKQICLSLGGNFLLISIDSIEYERIVPITAELLSGQVDFNQGFIFWLIEFLHNETINAYVFDGQVQDVLFEPLYISYERPEEQGGGDDLNILSKYYPPIHIDLLKVILRPEWLDNVGSKRAERIRKHLQGKRFENLSALTQYFYFTSRGQRYVWGATSLEYAISNIGFPGMDYDLFDWGMECPIEVRKPDAPLYRSVLCKAFPSIASIPWDATGKALSFYKGRMTPTFSIYKKYFWLYALRRITSGKIDLISSPVSTDHLFRKNIAFRNSLEKVITQMNETHENPLSKKGVELLGKMILSGRNYFDLFQKAVTLAGYFNRR
jgi:hypothetical protein